MAAVVEISGDEDSPTSRPRTRSAMRAFGKAPVTSMDNTPAKRQRRQPQGTPPKGQEPQAKSKLAEVVRQSARQARQTLAEVNAEQEADADQPEATEQEGALLDSEGVPAAARGRLLRLLRRWGPERAAQVLGLWAFLGEGGARPTRAKVHCLQAFGPAGTGKTAIVRDYLEAMRVQHVRINCGSLVSLGELYSTIAEELRLLAGEATEADDAPPQQDAPGPQLRGLDRLERAVQRPLRLLARTAAPRGGESGGMGMPARRVVVVLDNAQELPRLDPGIVELLPRLPEVLSSGGQLAVLTVGRLPLSSLGMLDDRVPPAVPFGPYAAREVEAILLRELGKKQPEGGGAAPGGIDLGTLVSTGLMKFAAPYVGHNLRVLISIGEDLLRSPLEVSEARTTSSSFTVLQSRIEQCLRLQTNLCDLSGFLAPRADTDNADAALKATLRGMTNAEKRMLVAAYISAYTDKADDEKLFLAECQKKKQRRGQGRKHRRDDGRPFYAHAPRAVPLMRFLAINHRLTRLAGSREAHSLGTTTFENLMTLRESQLLRLSGDRTAGADTRDPKVLCCADLPLVKACALDLNIDLAEYLC